MESNAEHVGLNNCIKSETPNNKVQGNIEHSSAIKGFSTPSLVNLVALKNCVSQDMPSTARKVMEECRGGTRV